MKILLRLAKEAKKYRGLFILAIFSTLALTCINLIAPRLMSEMIGIVSGGISENDEGMRKITYIAIVLLSIYMLKIIFRYLSNFMAHKAAWRLVEELRVKVYDKLQNLSIDYFRKHESGDLVSRTITDTAIFEQLFAHLIPESITNIITVTGVTIILFTINSQLALLTCIPIPFILVAGWIFATKVRPNFRKCQKFTGELSALLMDNYSGIQEIQAFGQQETVKNKTSEKARKVTKSLLHALNLSAIFHPTVEFLTSLGTVIVVGFGGYLAFMSQMDVADIAAFLLYLALFYAPITGIAQLLESMQQAIAGAERVIEILDAPETVYSVKNAEMAGKLGGEIEFKNVSFYYNENVNVLDDISFKIKAGQMLAVVGATGVGKSTLAQLISRFYDPVAGTIEIDGRDIKNIDLSSFRENISMVLQDTFLFNGTIAENIAFARPLASRDKIKEAAKIARIHNDIIAMPDGYDTMVGERGARLSGGQKQRIAIARAILMNAPVLILDEATASVDVATEADIQKAIQNIAGTRTIIAIAHRLSTIKRADMILVFENGKIIQRGNHEELSRVEGEYKKMCMIQERSIIS